MKKLILTIIGFVLLCFAIPMIFTKKYNNQEKIAEVLEENKEYETTADVWYKPHQRVNPTTLQVEVIDNNEDTEKRLIIKEMF